jgi:paraquat-inducible protein B
MTEREPNQWLPAGRSALRQIQQAMARAALSPEQRRAFTNGLRGLSAAGEQLKVAQKMMESFGPPVAQIQAVKRQLGEQRTQVANLQKQLDDIEAIVERLARASEQIVAFQQPFVRLAGVVMGTGGGEARTGHDEDDDDEPV